MSSRALVCKFVLVVFPMSAFGLGEQAHVEEFSREERARIEALRGRLQDYLKEEGDTVAKQYLSEDSTLWRYVLAQSQEANPLDESEAMFRRSVDWKKKVGLPQPLVEEWRGGKVGDSHFPSRAKTAKARLGDLLFYAGIMKAKTKNGGPFMADQMGGVDYPGLARDEFAFDCIIKSYVVFLEDAFTAVRAQGGKTRGTIVVDISEAGIGMLGYISLIKRISSNGVLNYPEITEKVYMVNAGWVVSTLWAAITPFLPSRTKGKFSILGYYFDDIIHPLIEGGRASLPVFLHGDLKDGDHSVCPALSVDEAYGRVVEEVALMMKERNANECAPMYPDAHEFLQAALLHGKGFSDDLHLQRIGSIQKLLALFPEQRE